MNKLRGYHVTCDGRALPEALTIDSVSAWLEDVIALSGLDVIAGPNVYEYHGVFIGFAVIAESHLAAHANTETGELYAELFSCKPFEVSAFVEATVRHFGIVDQGATRWRLRGMEG